MTTLMDRAREGFLLFDGAMGTMLQNAGLKPGALPEMLNLTDPALIESIHRAYVEAGSDIITTNTFQANQLKLPKGTSVAEVIRAGVACARGAGAKWVALDVGPLGQLLAPAGTLSFDDAYELFREQMIAGAEAGADLILIETVSDLYEAKAAVLAAKESTSLPVMCTMTFQEDGRTFLGTDPRTAAISLSALGVDALGANCSMGPEDLMPVVMEMLRYSRVPVLVQANAGLPEMVLGAAQYSVSPEAYSEAAARMAAAGVTLFGGCCGTDPTYIRALRAMIDAASPVRPHIKHVTALTSASKTHIMTGRTTVIGERINPTGKKKLQAALRQGDYDYLVREAIAQQDAGADALDVNCGLPDIDEPQVLSEAVRRIQAISTLPLVIDSADPLSLEAAVRAVNGRPIINSVNGKRSSMDAVFPIAKKYGALVMALTLDEDGIPSTAEGRVQIARRIIGEAARYGIPKEDLIIDCLTLTASAQQEQVLETLRAVSMTSGELGVCTSLGVSNVSFGLPGRDVLNQAFLLAALGAGLSAAILNPMSGRYREAVRAYRVLSGEDAGAEGYVAALADAPVEAAAPGTQSAALSLGEVIRRGLSGEAIPATRRLLADQPPLSVINEQIIPALSDVGDKFERGELFLPQLMQSAQAAQAAFGLIEDKMLASGGAREEKGRVLLATVEGDIHDIGKNIVRMMLQSHGFDVVDLGKDVPIEHVVRAIRDQNIRLCGLSALMTTTVGSMKNTIAAVREAGLPCKFMVGGAVLTEEYARFVGADYYAKDAIQAVKIAGAFFDEVGQK